MRMPMQDLFTRLPSMTNQQVEDLTPKAWAKEQREKTATAEAEVQSTELRVLL